MCGSTFMSFSYRDSTIRPGLYATFVCSHFFVMCGKLTSKKIKEACGYILVTYLQTPQDTNVVLYCNEQYVKL